LIDKAELGSIAAGALSLVGTAISVLTGLGLLTVLFSVVFGSMLTFIVQSRTQKTAWKRESELRKVEAIYGPLFQDFDSICRRFAGDEPFPRTLNYFILDSRWSQIRGTYQWLLIPKKLSEELELFFTRFIEFQELNNTLGAIIDVKLIPIMRELFGPTLIGLSYKVKLTSPGSGILSEGEINLKWCILNQKDPLEKAKAQYPGQGSYDVLLCVQTNGNQDIPLRNQPPEWLQQWNSRLDSVTKEVNADPVVGKLREMAKQIAKEATSLREQLRQLIENPMK
jgi:hypothetical protein